MSKKRKFVLLRTKDGDTTVLAQTPGLTVVSAEYAGIPDGLTEFNPFGEENIAIAKARGQVMIVTYPNGYKVINMPDDVALVWTNEDVGQMPFVEQDLVALRKGAPYEDFEPKYYRFSLGSSNGCNGVGLCFSVYARTTKSAIGKGQAFISLFEGSVESDDEEAKEIRVYVGREINLTEDDLVDVYPPR